MNGALPSLRPKASLPPLQASSGSLPSLPIRSVPAPPQETPVLTRREAREARVREYTDEEILYQDAPIDELDIEAGDFLAAFHFAEGDDGWAIKETYLFNASDDIESMEAISRQILSSYLEGASVTDEAGQLNIYLAPSDFGARRFEVAPIESITGNQFLASFVFHRSDDRWLNGGAYLFNVPDGSLGIIAAEIGNVDWSSGQQVI